MTSGGCKPVRHRYSFPTPEAAWLFWLFPDTVPSGQPVGRRQPSGHRRAGRHMEDIDQKVIEIVSEQMGVDKSEITRETHFINDLNADSLDTVELVMEFEDEFELSIPDEEAEKIQTVGQAIDYIKNNSSK